MKKEKCVYGVDVKEKVTPEEVRDAIMKCFKDAHHSVLEKSAKTAKLKMNTEFKQYSDAFIEYIARDMFEKSGGDYDTPTKASIKKVIERLASFASHYRDPKTIERHKKEIEELMKKM